MRDFGKCVVISDCVRARFSSRSPPEVCGEICGVISFGNFFALFCYEREFGFLHVTMGLCVSKPQTDGNDSDQHVDFAGGNVHLITTKESWDRKLAEAAKEGKIVIANFSATWCGPCKMIAPFYSELSVEHPSLIFLLVDVDELTEFSTSWDIKATPTFFFIRDGQQVDKLVGANKPELQKKITAILDLQPQAECQS